MTSYVIKDASLTKECIRQHSTLYIGVTVTRAYLMTELAKENYSIAQIHDNLIPVLVSDVLDNWVFTTKKSKSRHKAEHGHVSS